MNYKTETIELVVKYKVSYDPSYPNARQYIVDMTVKESPCEIVGAGPTGSYSTKKLKAKLKNKTKKIKH